MQNTVPFEDCPVGMFLSASGELCVKTEYGLDAFIIATGEKFWGGAKTLAHLRRVTVTPVEVRILQHARWIEEKNAWSRERKCSACGNRDNPITAIDGRYCWYCGAKMDAKEE